MVRLVKLIFFITGFNALLLQVVWGKVLSQEIGSDLNSSTIVVSIFMLGLGLGGYFGSLLSPRLINPFKFFLLAEIAITIFGVFSIKLIKYIGIFAASNLYGPGEYHSYFKEFILYFSLLLPSTILMGSSLPLLTEACGRLNNFSENVGKLYSYNIFGAALGALITGLYLIGRFGYKATVLYSSIITFCVLLIILLSYNQTLVSKGADCIKNAVALKRSEIYHRSNILVLTISFFIGFATLGYEILYFRIFVTYFSATSYVFPIVLSAYLILIMLGSFTAGLALSKKLNIRTIIFTSLLGTLITTPVVYNGPLFFKLLNVDLASLFFRTYFGSKTFYDYAFQVGIYAFLFMLPVFFMSLIFPVLVNLYSNNKANGDGHDVGVCYLTQCIGNFVGTLATTFVLVPQFGTIFTANFLLIIFCSSVVWILILSCKKKLIPLAIGIMLFTFYVEHMLIAPDFYKNFLYTDGLAPTEIIEDREGAALVYGPISVHSNDYVDTYYRVNIGSEPSTSFPSSQHLLKVWPVDVALSLMKSPPNNILLIGIGAASQALVIKSIYPNVNVTIVELVESLIDQMNKYGSNDLKLLLASSNVVVTDGRRFVNKAASNEVLYDYVQIGVFRTTTAGAGNLFTREFLQSVKKIMSDDGVLSFNASLPAVKAGINVFDGALIVAPKQSAVADAFFYNNDNLTFTKFNEDYTKFHKLLDSGSYRRLDSAVPPNAFVFLGADDLKIMLHEITEQRDDLVASENFIITNSMFKNAEDSRHWPHNRLAHPLILQR